MEIQSERLDDRVWHVYKEYEQDDCRPGSVIDLQDLTEKQPVLIYKPENSRSARVFALGNHEFYIGSRETLEESSYDGLGITDAKRNIYAIIGERLKPKSDLRIQRGQNCIALQEDSAALELQHGDVIHLNDYDIKLNFAFLGRNSH